MSMIPTIKVEVERDYARYGYAVWVTERRGVDLYVLAPDENYEWVGHKVDPSVADNRPSLRLPKEYADALLAALQEAGAKNRNRDHELGAMQGKLEATERHLSDMRRIAPDGVGG